MTSPAISGQASICMQQVPLLARGINAYDLTMQAAANPWIFAMVSSQPSQSKDVEGSQKNHKEPSSQHLPAIHRTNWRIVDYSSYNY